MTSETREYIIELEPNQLENLIDQQILKTMIYSKSTHDPLYYCEIVDNVECTESIGMYVIQQGKESEWYYSTTAGKLEVSKILNFKRLILISIEILSSSIKVSVLFFKNKSKPICLFIGKEICFSNSLS